MSDPEHKNWLMSLKLTQSNIVDIDTLDLDNKLLVIAAETDSRFSTYLLELGEQTETHHMSTKLETK